MYVYENIPLAELHFFLEYHVRDYFRFRVFCYLVTVREEVKSLGYCLVGKRIKSVEFGEKSTSRGLGAR